ncbi:MAG: Fe-S cluster assembly protein HesB [Streptosporangiales bacterium]|nr:Fe-S cluster assembly protein HesB [Streptosporangiales bacterium]
MARGTYDLHLAQDSAADALLSRDPLALLVGMLLDQQVPMEWAFGAPRILAERLGGDRLDAAEIATYDPDKFASLASTTPAIHRFPGSMAKRIQQLCTFLVEQYDGDASAVWTSAESGRDLQKRLTALPGFGKQKAQIFAALLGKQLDVRPEGWREAAGPYGEDGVHRSVADIRDEASLAAVREHKKEQKRAASAAKGPEG